MSGGPHLNISMQVAISKRNYFLKYFATRFESNVVLPNEIVSLSRSHEPVKAEKTLFLSSSSSMMLPWPETVAGRKCVQQSNPSFLWFSMTWRYAIHDIVIHSPSCVNTVQTEQVFFTHILMVDCWGPILFAVFICFSVRFGEVRENQITPRYEYSWPAHDGWSVLYHECDFTTCSASISPSSGAPTGIPMCYLSSEWHAICDIPLL